MEIRPVGAEFLRVGGRTDRRSNRQRRDKAKLLLAIMRTHSEVVVFYSYCVCVCVCMYVYVLVLHLP
jgi:hypothetical protein